MPSGRTLGQARRAPQAPSGRTDVQKTSPRTAPSGYG